MTKSKKEQIIGSAAMHKRVSVHWWAQCHTKLEMAKGLHEFLHRVGIKPMSTDPMQLSLTITRKKMYMNRSI